VTAPPVKVRTSALPDASRALAPAETAKSVTAPIALSGLDAVKPPNAPSQTALNQAALPQTAPLTCLPVAPTNATIAAAPLNVLAATALKLSAHLAPRGPAASQAQTALCSTAHSLVARLRTAHPHPVVKTLANAVRPAHLNAAPVAATVSSPTALLAPLTQAARLLTTAIRPRTVKQVTAHPHPLAPIPELAQKVAYPPPVNTAKTVI